MRKEDIIQVTEIDREAFPTQWPPNNYRRELQNKLGHFIVAYDDSKIVVAPEAEVSPEKGISGVASWVRQLLRRDHSPTDKLPPANRQYIAGFAGMWIMADEAHITNIAVRKCCQRQGIGELLLVSVIHLAVELKTNIVTLEVRISNLAARNLYRKYGFAEVGVRPAYYTDNREDALLMSTESIISPRFQARLQQLKQAHSQRYGMANKPLNIAEARDYASVR